MQEVFLEEKDLELLVLEKKMQELFSSKGKVFFCISKIKRYDLSDKEKELCENFCDAKKDEFSSGRNALKMAYKKMENDKDFDLAKDIFPKDILKNENSSPLLPKEFLSSITHTKNYAIAVICKSSNYSAIGIDFESVNRFKSLLLKRICTQDEIEKYFDNKIFLKEKLAIIFSAKEAFYKSLNSDKYVDFKEAHILQIEENSLELELLIDTKNYKKNTISKAKYFIADNYIFTFSYIKRA